MLVRLAVKPFINKPIKNYEGLRLFSSEDNTTSSYVISVLLDFGDIFENKDNKIDNVELDPIEHAIDEKGDANSILLVASSSSISLTLRLQCMS